MQVLAIDLGGTHATCAIVSDTRVVAKQPVASSGDGELAPMLPLFAGTFRNLCEQQSIRVSDCAGVALGFCGLADFRSSRVMATNAKYDDAPGIDLPGWARRELDLPFHIENDARLALLGERNSGAARGSDDVVMMTLGTGIGGAAMMQGRLVRGRHAQAGCLGGHLAMNPRGRRCTCGAIGCAESEASTWVLPQVCHEWPGFADSLLAGEPILNFETLFRVADRDVVANAVVEYSLDVWSALAVTLIHAYDPEILVVGGGVMHRADRVLPAICKRVDETAWTPWGKVRVEAAQCGDDAALLGGIPLFAETV